MGDGRYIVQCVNLLGARITTVTQLFGPTTHTIWNTPSMGDRDPRYDVTTDSLEFAFGSVRTRRHYLRLRDRKSVTLRPGCWPMASDATALIAICSAPVPGNIGAQAFSAFDWR